MARRDTTRPYLKKLQQVLEKIPTKTSEGSFEEGETYICATCDLPLKPCERHGSGVCSSMIRSNTQLEILESSIHEAVAGGGRRCLRCGAPIPARLLQRKPSRELCPECSPTPPPKRRRKASPGACP